MQVDQVNYEQIAAGFTTKSDKIRALSRNGVPTAEIARFLGIRYQHARNVLLQSGLHKTGKAAAAQPAVLPEVDRRDSAWVSLDSAGGLHVPADLLGASGLEPGARVYIGRTADGLELLSRRAALARAQALAKRYLPEDGPSMVDELVTERRRAAELENE